MVEAGAAGAHLQHVGRDVLRVAVVEHLVEQLVDEHEVVPDRVLVEGAKVRLEHRRARVQELKGHRRLRIARRHRHHVHVAVLDVHEAGVAYHLDRRPHVVLVPEDLRPEGVGDRAAEAVAVHARDNDLTLLVDEEQGADARHD